MVSSFLSSARAPRRSLRRRGAARSLAVVGASLAGALVLSPGVAAAAPERVAPVAPAAPTPDVLAPETQTLDWRSCFPDGAPVGLPEGSDRLECSDYVVPRDWDAPGDGLFLSVAISRLRPTDGTADATVLTNPGGPGGPGLSLPLLFLQAERTELTENRDIVGIDPRGTGASTNVTCSDAGSTTAPLDPRNRSEAATDLVLDLSEITAKACQNDPANLSPVISTRQTVRDLDLLRDLLDRDTVDWIGYSGGTWLGAAYAQEFPDRVGTFVLDANTEFTSPWQNTFELQPLGFQRRYEQDFLPWAARYDDRFALGATPAEVDATYERIRAAFAEESGGAALIDNVIAGSMYSKSTFSDLADLLSLLDEAVSEMPEGDVLSASDPAVKLLLARDDQPRSLAPVAPDAFESTFLNILCNDTPWTADRESLLAFSQEQGEQYPLIGWSTLAQPCAFWDRPEAATLEPRTGEGVPPLLMVQNDKDPATPIEGARIAREQFAGARLLEVLDEGDHTVYPGNPCVDAKVEEFILDEDAKATDSVCQGVGLPEPTPPIDEEGEAGAAPSPSATPDPTRAPQADEPAVGAGTPMERMRALGKTSDLTEVPPAS